MKPSEVIKNRWVQVFTCFMALLGLVGAIFQYDDRLAKHEPTMAAIGEVKQDVELLGEDLKYQKLITRRNAIQQRIWDLERYYGGYNVPQAPPPVKSEYAYLLRELADINRILKK